MNTSKEYRKPSVTVYGAVEEVTRQGDAEHSDIQGNPSTAYS